MASGQAATSGEGNAGDHQCSQAKAPSTGLMLCGLQKMQRSSHILSIIDLDRNYSCLSTPLITGQHHLVQALQPQVKVEYPAWDGPGVSLKSAVRPSNFDQLALRWYVQPNIVVDTVGRACRKASFADRKFEHSPRGLAVRARDLKIAILPPRQIMCMHGIYCRVYFVVDG